MSVTVLTVRGTGEPQNGTENALSSVTRLLDSTRFVVGADVVYPASIGPVNPTNDPFGPSEAESVAAGVLGLVAALRATPRPVAVLGYSLGAEVVSAFLERLAAAQFADCGDIAWVGLVANPCRAVGEGIDPDPVGAGISGAHGPWPHGLTVLQAANPGDVITSCPLDSPLRDLAFGVAPLTFAELGWCADLVADVRWRRWPVSLGSWRHPVQTWRRYGTAAGLMEGYLFGGQHNVAYVTLGIVARLATIINES